MRVLLSVLALGLWLGASISPVLAQKRVALLIGNASYTAAPLQNPRNDVTAMKGLLEQAGFDVVVTRTDLGRAAMTQALDDFEAHARGAEIGLVYFSGHGIEVGGTNYLIPVDAALKSDTSVKFEAIPLDDVLRVLDGATRLKLVLLDACRNNPFATSMRRVATRSAPSKGLAPLEGAAPDVMVAYAAAPGQTASDGEGTTSPFAKALVTHLAEPGTDIRLALGKVRDDVSSRTSPRQVPYISGSLGGGILALRPGNPTSLSPTDAEALTRRDFESAKQLASVAVWDAFLQKYPGSLYAVAAREERARLLAAATPPPGVPTTPAGPSTGPTQMAAIPVAPVPSFGSCGGVPQLASVTSRPARSLTPNEERCLKPRDAFKECDTCPEMIVVPAGSFTMGSPESEKERYADEGPQEQISIKAPFAVGPFAVTRGEFAAFVKDTNRSMTGGCSWQSPGFAQDDRHPVVCVNWNDATAYAAWLSRKTGAMYRLLSEAEREYVTRAGTSTPFWWGSGITPDQASYDGTSVYAGGGTKGAYRKGTVSVDSFEPNPWGLYNVHGNVWEWTSDCWSDTSVRSQRSIFFCNARVLRGGSWGNHPKFLRAAFRLRNLAEGDIDQFSGFRVARSIAARSDVSSELSSAVTNQRALAEARADEAQQRVAKLAADGESALKRGDNVAAQSAAASIETLRAELARTYDLMIVSRPGEPSGVFRVPDRNPNVRNYYLIVEAIGPNGQPIPTTVMSEEDGKQATVTKWGLRVSQQVYDTVVSDKRDDGIIQNRRIATKKPGSLSVDWEVPMPAGTGGAITAW